MNASSVNAAIGASPQTIEGRRDMPVLLRNTASNIDCQTVNTEITLPNVDPILRLGKA